MIDQIGVATRREALWRLYIHIYGLNFSTYCIFVWRIMHQKLTNKQEDDMDEIVKTKKTSELCALTMWTWKVVRD